MSLPQISGPTADGEFTYTHISPLKLREVWAKIKYGVELIKKTNNQPWIPEDVYTALMTGNASLYTFYNRDGAYSGFGVLELHYFPFDLTPAINIWLGHFREPGNGKYGIEAAKEVAKHAGIDRVVFCTPQDNSWVTPFRKLHTWYEV